MRGPLGLASHHQTSPGLRVPAAVAQPVSKLKLSRGGQLTRAALLLFGKDESAQFLPLP
ncbi:MAG: hypothetical protein IPN53_11405 [Comamonadaceae bacterium]|nr:hypothetical protein [Comamonadaceae bacterium]